MIDNSVSETILQIEECPSLWVKAALSSMFRPIISYLLKYTFNFASIVCYTIQTMICIICFCFFTQCTILNILQCKPDVLKYSPEKKRLFCYGFGIQDYHLQKRMKKSLGGPISTIFFVCQPYKGKMSASLQNDAFNSAAE